jgi:transglutaminase-like putative cysteine protease
MRRAFLCAVGLFMAVSVLATDEPGVISIRLAPAGHLPLGSSGDLYTFGSGVSASAAYQPDFLGSFGLQAGADFMMLPLQSEDAVHTASGFAGPVAQLPLGDRFDLFAGAQAGYYSWYPAGWQAEDAGGGGLLLGGSLGARFHWSDSLAAGVEASYRYFDKLYNGLSLSLALRYTIPWKPASGGVRVEPEIRPVPLDGRNEGVAIKDLTVPTLFPVLYAYYHEHPLGSITLHNYENRPAEDIAVSFFVERYMDNPKELTPVKHLAPGKEVTFDLYGLFTEELMEITEGTKVSARITLSYSLGSRRQRRMYTPAIEFHNRNALTWSDDCKIASFVTAKDPEVLSFARRVSGWMQAVQNPAVDENLQKGMALFTALKSYGLRYEVDPTTPFSELSESETEVDFLQFPRQTLQFTSGDCDDLSVLYAALLEAVGVETAVITVPGHIYPAFALKSPPEEARRSFSSPDDLLVIEGKTWVPVEITMCRESFAAAWREGAKQWREHSRLDQAQFYPTRRAWQTYQAVGFLEEGADIRLPERARVTALLEDSLEKHVQQEISIREARLLRRMEEADNRHIAANKLAVLYARHGLYGKALTQLQKINAVREYPPALINTGNIHYLRGQYGTALEFYRRALAVDGRNRTALLGSARCHHELENYGLAGRDYGRLQELAPQLASRFEYLAFRGEDVNRAASAAEIRKRVVWEEVQ